MISIETAPKSSKVINTLAFLLENGSSFAHQLSQIMNMDSREVYPMLKTWIMKGIISISKQGRRNIYSISQKFKSLISNIIRKYSFKGREFILAKAKQRFKRFLGRDPDPETVQVIEYFIDKALSGNPYVEGSTKESVAELLSRILKISLYDINEILRDLVQANILFVFRNRKARLESSLLT
jgi:DNA-binding PadR family transcriptional regulator